MYLTVAVISSVAYLGVLLYLFICIKFHKRGNSWQKDVPWAIPVATVAGLVTFVSFGISIWPVYGWATPAVEVVLFMGLLMSTSFFWTLLCDRAGNSSKPITTQRKTDGRVHILSNSK